MADETFAQPLVKLKFQFDKQAGDIDFFPVSYFYQLQFTIFLVYYFLLFFYFLFF